MGSLGSPKLWVPYLNNKDCSLGFCSLYCPQWCYIIYPPPPPLAFPDDNNGGRGRTFSPLVVAIIGILASTFLLVAYYTIISKYCTNNDDENNNRRRQRRRTLAPENPSTNGFETEENYRNPSNLHEAWHVVTYGLDEALIKAIEVRKYNRNDGFVEGTDCSVCLSEFQQDECLRVLPKCRHAFHVQCIDTWLRSHSNCPLCRASVAAEISPAGELVDSGDRDRVLDDTSQGVEEVCESNVGLDVPTKSSASASASSVASFRALSELGSLDESHSAVIEVRDEMRRSVSMDFLKSNCVGDCDEDEQEEEEEEEVLNGVVGDVEECSNFGRASCSKSNERTRFTMKRSVSSGRFFLTRPLGGGRGKTNSIIPL